MSSSGSRCWQRWDRTIEGGKKTFLLNRGLEPPFLSIPRLRASLGVLPTVPALHAPQLAPDSRSRLLNAPEPESGHNFPSASPRAPHCRLLLPCSPAPGGYAVPPATGNAASPGAHEVADHRDTGQGTSHGPPKLPRSANSKFAGPAASSARPSARSPQSGRSPLSLPQAPTLQPTPPGASRPRGLPSDLCSRRAPRSANRRSRARRSRTLTSPSRSGHLGARPQRTPTPGSAAARSGGYVSGDARPAPPVACGMTGGGPCRRGRCPRGDCGRFAESRPEGNARPGFDAASGTGFLPRQASHLSCLRGLGGHVRVHCELVRCRIVTDIGTPPEELTQRRLVWQKCGLLSSTSAQTYWRRHFSRKRVLPEEAPGCERT